ncbi:hypothetical protein [Pseudomonas sp. M30-35]|uniref:hypothetical protein n=1 Tax=Pseudomonas sp. M30-35 TaxID=1981174 RepID=UPI0012FD6F2C|nr:hypothetical protein [Pseudomonas sp. M30-35]
MMHNGYYWIEYNGVAEIAYYSDEEIEEIESGNIISGVWHGVGEFQTIYLAGEVVVLDGPLSPPPPTSKPHPFS